MDYWPVPTMLFLPAAPTLIHSEPSRLMQIATLAVEQFNQMSLSKHFEHCIPMSPRDMRTRCTMGLIMYLWVAWLSVKPPAMLLYWIITLGRTGPGPPIIPKS